METKSPVYSPHHNRRYNKEKNNCAQNLKLFSLDRYICAFLYLWFTYAVKDEDVSVRFKDPVRTA